MIIGFIAKQVLGAALTGAAGLAIIEAAKGTNIGNIAKQAAVGVTEVGIRGYKMAEQGAEKAWATANEVFSEAKVKADEDMSDPWAGSAGSAHSANSSDEEVVVAAVLVEDVKPSDGSSH